MAKDEWCLVSRTGSTRSITSLGLTSSNQSLNTRSVCQTKESNVDNRVHFGVKSKINSAGKFDESSGDLIQLYTVIHMST